MDLDLLDVTYPMGKSKLPFEDFVYDGLTGVLGGPTGLAHICHFGCQHMPPYFLVKLAY
jgi:hypothetical protein